jgi:hypothetical protein
MLLFILEYSIICTPKWLWIKMFSKNKPRNGVEAIKGMQDALYPVY